MSTPVETTALVEAPERVARRVLRPTTDAGDMIEHQNRVRAWVKAALVEGRDYGLIPGTKEKALLKPGAEKITAGFGCVAVPRIVEEEIDHYHEVSWLKRKKEWKTQDGRRVEVDVERTGTSLGLYRYVVAVDIVDPDGNVRGTGLGSCSSMESKYVDRPRDVENTILKMARKRAHVGAVLDAFGLSGEFRDLAGEDAEEIDPDGKAAPAADREGMFPMPFGKSKGTALADMDTKDLKGGLDWNLKTCPTKYTDFQAEAKAELERRANRAEETLKQDPQKQEPKTDAPPPSFTDEPLPPPPDEPF